LNKPRNISDFEKNAGIEQRNGKLKKEKLQQTEKYLLVL
jgi:hypothetical protein